MNAPANPVLKSTEILKQLLESAGAVGATGEQLAAAGHIPVGTASSALNTLAKDGLIGVTNPGHKPRIYALLKYGAHPFTPGTRRRGELEATPQVAIPVADIRVVLTVGGERKSMTYDQAENLYLQLKPVFERKHG